MLPVVEIPKVKDSKDGPKTTQQGLKLFAAKQRPGPEQVALAAEVNVPGSWFTWDESSRAERQEYYRALLHSSSRNGTFSNPPRAASPRNWTRLLVFCYDHVGVMCLVWVLVGAGC